MARITSDLTQKIRRPPAEGLRGVSGRFPPGQHCWATRYLFAMLTVTIDQISVISDQLKYIRQTLTQTRTILLLRTVVLVEKLQPCLILRNFQNILCHILETLNKKLKKKVTQICSYSSDLQCPKVYNSHITITTYPFQASLCRNFLKITKIMKTEFFETPFDIDNKYRNTMYMRKEGSKICTACRVSAAEIYFCHSIKIAKSQAT